MAGMQGWSHAPLTLLHGAGFSLRTLLYSMMRNLTLTTGQLRLGYILLCLLTRLLSSLADAPVACCLQVQLPDQCRPPLLCSTLTPSLMQVNILEAVQYLVRDSRAQDSLIFAFSGHGCMDVSHNQERDGILPSDYERVLARLYLSHGQPRLSWESILHQRVSPCKARTPQKSNAQW